MILAVYDKGTSLVLSFVSAADGDAEGMAVRIKAAGHGCQITNLPGFPDSTGGRFMVSDADGCLVFHPDIVLSAPERANVGEAVVVSINAIEGAPAAFMLLISPNEIGAASLTVEYTPGDSVTFDEPGTYTLKIMGPEPWRSNQKRIEIVEVPDAKP